MVKSPAGFSLTNGPELRKGSRINLRELTKDFRFEASTYGIQARQAQDEIRAAGFQTKPVYGEGGLAFQAHNAFQFARNYVKSAFGVPFMGSSDIIFTDFRPSKFLSKKNTKRLESLMIQPWDVLLSCSGTVGNVSLAPPAWKTYALSQHVLRLRFENPAVAGFVACFLRSRWGRAQTVGSSYGSVISHIEPQHLERVLVPLLPSATIITVGNAFCEAANDRAEANALLRKAESMFASIFDLPSFPVAVESHFSRVRLSELDGRFDGNYHSPKPRAALASLKSHGVELTTVKDFAGDDSVRAVTKFRERTFAKNGLPFVSSKEVLQIDPINLDRLAVNVHLGDMDEIGLKPGMILVSRSGTVGRIMMVPQYMDGWAGTEHLLRIVSNDLTKSGFLYAWLNSPYGQAILKRYRYGSVIVSLDRWMLESMPVPILPQDVQDTISSLAIKCSELQDRAWNAEQMALSTLSNALSRV